jgi:signal recognition particle receptor subunit beta
VQIDFPAHEVAIKLVYYGPAHSGKTTNLLGLHGLAGSEVRVQVMTFATEGDRTIFFELLPLTFRSQDGGVSLQIQLFTVPGPPIHSATRRLVLQGADGVALIADSRLTEHQHNIEAFYDLRKNLRTNGLTLSKMPLVIQFNKRDLPEIRSEADLAKLAERGREPVYLAVATQRVGIVETFIGLLHLTWERLDAIHGLEKHFSIDGELLLRSAAQQLGVTTPIGDLLARRVGGAKAATPPTNS